MSHPEQPPFDKAPAPTIPHDQSFIEYPCAFPIKVMGVHHETFIEAVVAIVNEHAPDFDAASIEHRPSSTGKYLGLTVTVNATSREQLDNIYRRLTGHPLVKYVL
jgi:uncharacterized protein